MKRFLIIGLFLLGVGWALLSVPGLATQGTFDSIVLDFKEETALAEIGNQLDAIAAQYKIRPQLNSRFSDSDHLYVMKGDRKTLDALRHSELKKYTEYIEPDYIYSIPETNTVSAFNSQSRDAKPSGQAPNDPLYGKQWNLHAINAEPAWADTKGSGVTVAVIDTGITQVEDLKDTKFVPGYDFVSDRENAQDDNGHGTHVAGTIAQSTNNSFGVAGIAYQASLMPLKVLSAGGGGTVADIAEAIRFAADNHADVINLSLGGGGESSAMREAIDYAHKRGIVIVGAAGNSNRNGVDYPARYAHVIGVSALSPSGDKTPYSSFGAGVDISAPGGDLSNGPAGGILQHTRDPRTGESLFAAFQGTSMAAPHVAGVAALVKAAGVKDPDQVESVLMESSRKIDEDTLNHYGAGKLDAGAAVALALKGKITFNDFFRWLRDNGYLNLKFWFDGGAVALLPKLAMVLGSYLLAWFMRAYFPFAWSWSLAAGLVTGSSGWFFLRGFYIFDIPQAPFRVLGSSLPELGNAVQATSALNPLTASVLIPAALIALFLGHQPLKWFAIGSTLGVAVCLAVNAVIHPHLMWLGDGTIARLFLATQALLCYGLARLALKPENKLA